MIPIVKICGITSQPDAALCVNAGADWLGFIFHEASPRYVAPQTVAGFETDRVKRVGVFVNQGPDEVLSIMEEAALDLAQLHGNQSADFCRAVGPERVIRAVWPRRFNSMDDFRRELDGLAGSATYFLLDAGISGGGHGQAIDLESIKNFGPPTPWLLAGGLTPERVAGLGPADTLAFDKLAGFDFNSGVEKAPGLKDGPLVESAVRAVRENFFAECQYCLVC